MKTYHQITFTEISNTLMQVAVGMAAACGYKYIVSDMVHSLSDFHEKGWAGLKEPYYFAIREMGTESGYKEHCVDRCKGLGYPLVIVKIEPDKVCDLNMTIMFTHGWMDRDNNYMEQEFNSI